MLGRCWSPWEFSLLDCLGKHNRKWANESLFLFFSYWMDHNIMKQYINTVTPHENEHKNRWITWALSWMYFYIFWETDGEEMQEISFLERNTLLAARHMRSLHSCLDFSGALYPDILYRFTDRRMRCIRKSLHLPWGCLLRVKVQNVEQQHWTPEQHPCECLAGDKWHFWKLLPRKTRLQWIRHLHRLGLKTLGSIPDSENRRGLVQAKYLQETYTVLCNKRGWRVEKTTLEPDLVRNCNFWISFCLLV